MNYYINHYKKTLLYYNLFVLTSFLFLIQIPDFYAESWSLYANVSMILSKLPSFMPHFSSEFVPVGAVLSVHCGKDFCCAREARCANLVGGVDSNWWVCAGLRKMILAWDLYCANPNPDPDYQSVSWFRKGLGTRASRSTREYNLVTAI